MFQSTVSDLSGRRRWVWVGISTLVFLSGTIAMIPHGSLHARWNVPPFLAGAVLMLIGFYLALLLKCVPLLIIGSAAVGARVLLLWQAPGDDIYRYIWEGRLLLQNVNPYLHPPDATGLVSFRDAIWDSVQHKTFSAIYPPLAECSFATLAVVSPSVFFFKIVFAAADLLTGALLWVRYGGQAALFYLWNPLVVYAFAGGGHYDSFFILTVALGWLAWEKGKATESILWIGAAVAFKWMALPILAWAVLRSLRDFGLRAAIINGAAGLAPLLISWTFVGLWTGEWTWRLHPEKFAEYARSAELIPGIVGWLWEGSRYHNGWFLAPVVVGWAVVILKARRFTSSAEWSLFLALIFSPLVHAWYFTWLMPFAVASRNLGSLLLTSSVFVYFIVYHRLNAEPDLGWMFTPAEIALLWAPFVFGFLWAYLRPLNMRWPQRYDTTVHPA
jgi:alpha-1,6-mannosyltransferase